MADNPISNSNPAPRPANLPHQADDVRPEDIVDHEQEAPETIITPDDYDHLPYENMIPRAELPEPDKELKNYIAAARAPKPAPLHPAIPEDKPLADTSPTGSSFRQKLKKIFS